MAEREKALELQKKLNRLAGLLNEWDDGQTESTGARP